MMIEIAAAAAGAFAWSFTEYAMHNWRGHKGRGRNAFSREHLAHHADNRYFAPTFKKVITAAIAVGLLLPATAPFVGLRLALVFVSAFVATYAAYEVLHRRLHTHPPRGPYGRWARRHHFYHHFRSPKQNHGVTSPLWDLVFGTYARPGVVRVPVRQSMSWLVDSSGAVKPEFAADYELGRRSVR